MLCQILVNVLLLYPLHAKHVIIEYCQFCYLIAGISYMPGRITYWLYSSIDIMAIKNKCFDIVTYSRLGFITPFQNQVSPLLRSQNWTGRPLTSQWVLPTQGAGPSATLGSHSGTLETLHGSLWERFQPPPVLTQVWYGMGFWAGMNLLLILKWSFCWVSSISMVLSQIPHTLR